MHSEEEGDQLQLLEQRIEFLIEVAKALAQEKAALAEKLQIRKKTSANLAQELRKLKRASDKAKQRIVSTLMRIDQSMGKDGSGGAHQQE